MDKFISVVDQTGRTSTLSLEKDGIQIIGVLNHCDIINPKTREDAQKLINYLSEKFMGNKGLPRK